MQNLKALPVVKRYKSGFSELFVSQIQVVSLKLIPGFNGCGSEEYLKFDGALICVWSAIPRPRNLPGFWKNRFRTLPGTEHESAIFV